MACLIKRDPKQVFLFDNRALTEVCQKALEQDMPRMTDLNQAWTDALRIDMDRRTDCTDIDLDVHLNRSKNCGYSVDYASISRLIYVSICIFVCKSACLTLCLFVCLLACFVSLFVCHLVCLSLCLFVYSTYLSTVRSCLYVSLYTYCVSLNYIYINTIESAAGPANTCSDPPLPFLRCKMNSFMIAMWARHWS